MAGSFDDKGSGPGKAGKRRSPTIEGKATEIAVEPDAEVAASAKDEAAPAPEGTASIPAAESETASETSDVEQPETVAAPEPASRRRGSGTGAVLSHLTAGLLGGLAGAGALAVAWTYLPVTQQAEAPDLAPLEGRLAKLEAAPASADTGPEIAKLESRLDALEHREPETPPQVMALADRVAQLEASLNAMAEAAKDGGSVADAAAISQQINEAETRLDAKIDAALAKTGTTDDASIAALKKEVAEIAAKLRALTEAELGSGEASRLVPEIAVLDERLGKIESALPSLLDAVDRDAADTNAATLAIAFANLRSAVDGGRPYAAELATLAALSPGAGDLGGLLDYEDEGIPTLRALTVSFRETRDAALSGSTADADGSILGRLMASAESLVKIRRIDENAEGNTPGAVLARAGAELEQGDLPDAVKEVETLEGAPRAAFATWLDQAQARLGAEQTLQRLQNILLVSLGGNASSGGDKTQEQD